MQCTKYPPPFPYSFLPAVPSLFYALYQKISSFNSQEYADICLLYILIYIQVNYLLIQVKDFYVEYAKICINYSKKSVFNCFRSPTDTYMNYDPLKNHCIHQQLVNYRCAQEEKCFCFSIIKMSCKEQVCKFLQQILTYRKTRTKSHNFLHKFSIAYKATAYIKVLLTGVYKVLLVYGFSQLSLFTSLLSIKYLFCSLTSFYIMAMCILQDQLLV
eukprot:TRINITY_DN191_c2_g1_i8.p1 TRINITY_DN191_c2_g1~~TRINITY_DN191_c2_g1_i8.p1  ORF type:complete len:215 (-),score=-25.62 TRINITY_DN191_c2_g1_i8:266-910(-)